MSEASPHGGVAVELLRDVARSLAGGRETGETLHACVQAIVDRLDAAFARIWVLAPGGDELELLASAGMYTHLDGAHARVRVGAFKIGRIAERREPHLSNDVLRDPELSDPAWARREGMVSFAGYPLVVGEDLVGVLGLFARHELDASVLLLLEAVADAIAMGIRRLEAERVLQEQAEVAEILYHAGRDVAEVRKLDAVVQRVTDLATRLTGAQFGAFFYNAVDERGESYTLYTLSGVDREAFARFPLPRNTAIFEPTFRASSIERHVDITTDPRFGRNDPYFGMPEGHLPVRSYLAVPVVSRSGEVFGGLFFGHGEPGVFDERAERLAVGLAGHASVAMDATRVFELEHRLALNFQRTLLSADIPEIPGARLTQRYLPASELAAVGGDWHDTIVLPDGTLAITIGDVTGHDLGAAVTMGRLRNAIQLYALDGHGPADALANAGRFLHRAGITEYATAIHARYDPATRTLSMARAGHPPPLILGPDRSPIALPLESMRGALLGVTAPPRDEITIELAPGSIALFFTDGLVERRHEPLSVGLQRLERAVVDASTSTTTSFCDEIVDRMIDRTAIADDIAMIALFVDDA